MFGKFKGKGKEGTAENHTKADNKGVQDSPAPSSMSSIVNDTKADSLPNIISKFRTARLSSGYDEPTYFGFAIDIHSQQPEAEFIYNPFTGLRANPLFYIPSWLKADADGQAAVNDGKLFTDLNKSAAEACALQYLNSFTPPIKDNLDEISTRGVKLKKAANSLINENYNRGYYLAEFIKALNYIQEKTPWAFKEIDGLTSLWQATQSGYDFKPISIGITGDETVDLRLTRLAELYRMLSYDSFNGRKVLPPNLEKFSMDIYYLDLRFLKLVDDAGINGVAEIGTSSRKTAKYDAKFAGQINFGGIAFRCLGCKFDFSSFLENATAVKANTPDNNFQPKIKITVERVLPATYFGDRSFGLAGFGTDEGPEDMSFDNALGGALDLGPFTGGVNRILSAGRRALTNVLGTPQRALNDALLGIQRQFEGGVDNLLGSNGAVNSRPFEKKSVENLLNERKTGGKISTDVFPGASTQPTGKISTDVFPGIDNRKTNPIKRDEFLGKDVRTAAPIKQDVFPGSATQPTGKISNDLFPGDVPVSVAINQRKSGGKINSQNPYKQ